ncbi:MAG TPA: sulfatase-like hydrolase/transferase, partial [Pirellulales bacterium]|nr:sulfatase-like hydrolase/transferase [Pirellulales bacterium]
MIKSAPIRSSLVQHFSAVLLAVVALASAPAVTHAADAARPNFLWLTSEDHGPQMGAYGDRYATTPNVDALAAKGMIYLHCWSNAPVCAPARTTLISGLYPPSTGAEHMRSMVPYPQGKRMFPQYLREAGYYCTNNAKQDYNLSQPGEVWDESSKKAHWKNRQPGQPFFAVFNSEKSHESQVRKRPHTQVHDPAQVRVPAYHPDTPEVRQDWAQYYDGVSSVDADAGARLKQLAEDGLAADTIVFYFADHGPGMPRSKRWPRESGLHVPLVVYIPEKFAALRSPDYQPGGRSERLVSFVDFAPTLLSLAGIEPPQWMQGSAFLGKHQAEPRSFVFGFRGRMDERYDLIRCVSDGRYVYIRNYRPDKIYGQHLDYMWQTPTTRIWEAQFKAGQLNAAQSAFWKTKPPEELYELASDPDEVQNLSGESQHAAVRDRLRAALRQHTARIRDVGFLPEGEIHRRSAGSTPYDMGHDPAKYPFERVFATAELASALDPAALPALKTALGDSDSAVRYWGVLGHLMRGASAVAADHDELLRALEDSSPDVAIAAAEALGRYGSQADLQRALPQLG